MLTLIDGDILAHMSCKSRFNVKPLPGQLYDNIEIVLLDKSSHTFSVEEDREYLENSWGDFKNRLENLLLSTFASDYLMAVKSDENYRSVLYDGYKMNRHSNPSNLNKFVPIIRKLAIHEDIAIEAVGREADDMLCIWAHECMRANKDYIIASIDKDLKCIPGLHYHIRDKKIFEINEIEANLFFYSQLLSGDPTDNIPGIPGIGPIKASKLLYGTTSEEDMQEIVLREYVYAFGDAWRDILLSNGKLLYLQKHEADFFNLSLWPAAVDLYDTYIESLHDRLVCVASPLDSLGGAGAAKPSKSAVSAPEPVDRPQPNSGVLPPASASDAAPTGSRPFSGALRTRK